LATAAGALLNAWLLYRGVRKQNVYQPKQEWRALLIRIVLANVVMGIVLHFTAGDTAIWATLNNAKRILWLSELVAGGAATYFASLWLFGLRPAHLKH
jgi:putative peptidoglycan lipid II flippase